MIVGMMYQANSAWHQLLFKSTSYIDYGLQDVRIGTAWNIQEHDASSCMPWYICNYRKQPPST